MQPRERPGLNLTSADEPAGQQESVLLGAGGGGCRTVWPLWNTVSYGQFLTKLKILPIQPGSQAPWQSHRCAENVDSQKTLDVDAGNLP